MAAGVIYKSLHYNGLRLLLTLVSPHVYSPIHSLLFTNGQNELPKIWQFCSCRENIHSPMTLDRGVAQGTNQWAERLSGL